MSKATHTKLEQRAIALAALTLVARQVNDIALKGTWDVEDFRCLIHSIFEQDSPSAAGLYGGVHNLRGGLKLSNRLLSAELDAGQARPLLSCIAALLRLEKRLAKNPAMLAKLAEGLDRIRKQARYFGDETHENVIASIAALYGETLSTIKPRIIVHGKEEHLRQQAHTQRIRALLMAGIRAAHVWHAAGGTQATLLLHRRALRRECEKLLESSFQG